MGEVIDNIWYTNDTMLIDDGLERRPDWANGIAAASEVKYFSIMPIIKSITLSKCFVIYFFRKSTVSNYWLTRYISIEQEICVCLCVGEILETIEFVETKNQNLALLIGSKYFRFINLYLYLSCQSIFILPIVSGISSN